MDAFQTALAEADPGIAALAGLLTVVLLALVKLLVATNGNGTTKTRAQLPLLSIVLAGATTVGAWLGRGHAMTAAIAGTGVGAWLISQALWAKVAKPLRDVSLPTPPDREADSFDE